jgi:hypothetical protein
MEIIITLVAVAALAVFVVSRVKAKKKVKPFSGTGTPVKRPGVDTQEP